MPLIKTPPPHGGKLVERVVKKRDIAEKMIAGCPTYELKPTTLPDGTPIRHVYREIMSVCYGFFSPVEGSMVQNELERVLNERRLLSEWIFPYPILFDISEEDYKALDVKEGDRLLLMLKGQPFATLDIEEVYKIDPVDVATRTFGTPEKNPEVVREPFNDKHPGYVIYKMHNPVILAGKYTIVNEPKFKEPYDRFWFPPSKCREVIKNEKKWRTVIAHQTRNVPHVGHEMLMKCAAYTGDIEPCHGILVNAIIGAKRRGDYPDEAILEGHEAVNKYGYIKPERHMVTFTLWDMRYGNPIESLLHGVIRQNMGCTHTCLAETMLRLESTTTCTQRRYSGARAFRASASRLRPMRWTTALRLSRRTWPSSGTARSARKSPTARAVATLMLSRSSAEAPERNGCRRCIPAESCHET